MKQYQNEVHSVVFLQLKRYCLKCYICPRGAFITEVEQVALYFFLFKSRRALTSVNSRGQQSLFKV